MSKQTRLGLQGRQGASPALPSPAEPLNATGNQAPLSPDRNSEERSRDDDSRPTVGTRSRHSVFVLANDGKPLTPTTPTRARKLLRAGAAVPVWSRFNTFGIRLVGESRREVPLTAMGVDHGTKFEGYSVVVGDENVLNVKLDLPDKKHIARKLKERRMLRRARRRRNCRRRPVRVANRVGRSWLAPSQGAIVGSRLKIMRVLMCIYPVTVVALENVRFNHVKYRWGANFSTVEMGKSRVRGYVAACGAALVEYRGHETKALREKYGYRKTRDKSADKFTAHCSDSLALAVDVSTRASVDVGPFLVVDDTYRPVRRKLHYTQPARGGARRVCSRGTVFGLRKGLLVGTTRGKVGRLCGETTGIYRYLDANGRRHESRRVVWACGHFAVREAVSCNRGQKE